MRTGQNIYKRRDGRWEARVPLGKRQMVVHILNICTLQLTGRYYFRRIITKDDFVKNTQVISTALFSDAAYNWLLNSVRRWKPSTYIKYKNCLEKYILPKWEKLYVRDIQQGTQVGRMSLTELPAFYPDNQYDHQRDFEIHIKLSSCQMYRNGF